MPRIPVSALRVRWQPDRGVMGHLHFTRMSALLYIGCVIGRRKNMEDVR